MTATEQPTYLLDVNVLLALSLPHHQHHRRATVWFDSVRSWATTPLTETAYVRLLLNRRVVGYDIPAGPAVAALRTMRELPGHRFLADDVTLAEPGIDIGHLAGSGQVTDVHLVALAARHDVLMATVDGSLERSLGPARIHVLVLPIEDG